MALTVWSQTKYPRSALGALDLSRVLAILQENGSRSCSKFNTPLYPSCPNIVMRYYYVRYKFQKKVLSIQYVPTAEQTADIFTKPLSLTKFVYFRDKLGVDENTSLVEREC